MVTSYIGADVDSKMIDIAVERRKKIVRRYRIATAIPELLDVLHGIQGVKILAFEEGPLAHWLYRNVKDHVDEVLVSDPRRNAYIAKDGDKDDPIDAGKLAALARGGFLRRVYHSDDEGLVLLKRWVGLYHDRVDQAVREINKLRGRCRHYGVRPASRCLRSYAAREEWLGVLSETAPHLVDELRVCFGSLDVFLAQIRTCRQKLSQQSRPYGIVELWRAVPGIGPIRSVTLLAYLDTPYRFASKAKLWKYCGVGIERCSSGKDRYGKPKKGLLQLAWQVNKRLKDVVMGAAISAIGQKKNPFATKYVELLTNGVTPSNARHTVSRRLLTVLWGMWKSNQPYDPGLV